MNNKTIISNKNNHFIFTTILRKRYDVEVNTQKAHDRESGCKISQLHCCYKKNYQKKMASYHDYSHAISTNGKLPMHANNLIITSTCQIFFTRQHWVKQSSGKNNKHIKVRGVQANILFQGYSACFKNLTAFLINWRVFVHKCENEGFWIFQILWKAFACLS